MVVASLWCRGQLLCLDVLRPAQLLTCQSSHVEEVRTGEVCYSRSHLSRRARPPLSHGQHPSGPYCAPATTSPPARVGKPAEALRLFCALLPDCEWVLGRDHPDTLRTRSWVDYLQRQTGDES